MRGSSVPSFHSSPQIRSHVLGFGSGSPASSCRYSRVTRQPGHAAWHSRIPQRSRSRRSISGDAATTESLERDGDTSKVLERQCVGADDAGPSALGYVLLKWPRPEPMIPGITQAFGIRVPRLRPTDLLKQGDQLSRHAEAGRLHVTDLGVVFGMQDINGSKWDNPAITKSLSNPAHGSRQASEGPVLAVASE